MVLHTVTKGETLYSIANHYGVNEQRLRINNGIDEDARLAVGQCVAVMFEQLLHTVSPGETLYSIAEKYSVTTMQLLRNNLFLGGRDLVFPGDELVIEYERAPLGSYEIGGYGTI